MKNLRKIAGILLLIFTINFMPVSANAWLQGSKFGISGVSYEELEGKRNLYVNFNYLEVYKDIKEIKLYTKVVNYQWDYENNQSIKEVIDGPTVVLNEKLEGQNKIKGILNETQVSNFGAYEVSKIEMILNDGSKRVSYNSSYHTSLSDNDKENGEIIDLYGEVFWENSSLSLDEGKFEFKKIKLGQDQSYTFKIQTQKDWIYPSEVYVTFTKDDQDSNREQVVKSEKLEDGTYKAKLNLTNSLDTGRWRVSKVNIVDNYGRSYDLANNYWNTFEVVSANTDIEAPKLNSIEVSPKVYDAKDLTSSIKYTLDITDDMSGFKNGSITIVNGELRDSIWIDNYNKVDGKYQTNYNRFSENGIWKIESIYLTDKNGNYVTYVQELKDYMNGNDQYIEKDFSDCEIEVINLEKKEANIELLEVVNDKPEINNGKEIDLQVKLKSDVRLEHINMNYTSKDKNKSFYLYGYINPEYDENWNIIENKDGIYTFNIKGTNEALKYLATNNYQCNNFSVSYYTGNSNNIYKYKYFANSAIENSWWGNNYIKVDLSKLDITCNNPNEDITPPEIVDITTDKKIIVPGDSVELKIEVKDDNSGVQDWMNLNYNSLNMDNISLRYDKESSSYIGTVKVPEYATTGKYTISYISLHDIAENYKYYNWYNEEDKVLLSKGTILVKSDLNEMMPPEISTDIEEGKEYIAPFTPNVSSDHGDVTVLLDGKEYKIGDPINKLGNHQLYIEATGVDGSKSTKLIKFRVKGEINDQTKPEDIVDQIMSTEDKIVEVEVSSENKEIDKSIFEAIKGEDKVINFKQDDGTIWSFNGKDITDDKLADIGNLKISVSTTPEEENKEQIENLDKDAKFIHFDHHGVLPGKATVKIKVDKPEDLMGKELTFYYFNPETQKAEKVQGPLSIDNEGYVTVEIEHCSDYFLSTDETLHLNDPVITVEKEEIELVEGETKYINAKVTPEEFKLEYTSSNESVAIINNEGLITAKAEGEAVITVKVKDVVKEVKVKVKKKPAIEEPKPQEPIKPIEPQDPVIPVITVEKEEIELLEGETKYINAKVTPDDIKLEYTSTNENIVTINEDGLITAKAEGEARITVKAKEVIKEIIVKVKKKEVIEKPIKPENPVIPQPIVPQPPIEGELEEKPVEENPIKPIIMVNFNKLELRLGEVFKINAKVVPEDKKLEYISNNSNIIEVLEDGTIIAKNAGEAIVTIKCEDVTSIINVIVKSLDITNDKENNEEQIIQGNTDNKDNNQMNTNDNKENKEEKLPVTGNERFIYLCGLAIILIIVGSTVVIRKKNILEK